MEQDGTLPHSCVLTAHGSLPLSVCVCVCVWERERERERAGMSTCVLLGHSNGFQHITDNLCKDEMVQWGRGLGSLLISKLMNWMLNWVHWHVEYWLKPADHFHLLWYVRTLTHHSHWHVRSGPCVSHTWFNSISRVQSSLLVWCFLFIYCNCNSCFDLFPAKTRSFLFYVYYMLMLIILLLLLCIQIDFLVSLL